jgi:hypothetical protein
MLGLLEQVSTTSSTLDQLIASAGENLSSIENTLGTRMRAFQGAIGSVVNQISLLNETAASTVTDAGSLVQSIEDHHRALVSAAQAFVQTQQEVDGDVENRRASLDRLLTSINERAEDIGGLMQSFSTMMEQSLRQAEERARDLGTVLSDTTRSATGSITQHFEAIRSKVNQDRHDTTEEMQGIYERTANEVGNMFTVTLDRFRGSADEIRGMAAGIQRELTAVRDDLRRTTIDIPRETAEQAREVRRVLEEQIKTLGALTDVIGRAGPGLDVAEPVRPAPTSGRDGPSVSTSPAFQASRPTSTPASTRSFERTGERPAAQSYRDGGQVREATNRPLRPSAKSVRPQATQERGPGWLSDLLARASVEEHEPLPEPEIQEPAPSHNVALQGLAFDVTRLIDDNALAQAWERFRQGERHVFTRRIYSLAGQQTFDEIRRRFRSDPEFHDTVNRYTQEFERLLREIAPEDQDGSVARGYLASETGKVYTILAHAAGRLE